MLHWKWKSFYAAQGVCLCCLGCVQPYAVCVISRVCTVDYSLGVCLNLILCIETECFVWQFVKKNATFLTKKNDPCGSAQYMYADAFIQIVMFFFISSYIHGSWTHDLNIAMQCCLCNVCLRKCIDVFPLYKTFSAKTVFEIYFCIVCIFYNLYWSVGVKRSRLHRVTINYYSYEVIIIKVKNCMNESALHMNM